MAKKAKKTIKKKVEKNQDVSGQVFIGFIILGLAGGLITGSIWIGLLLGLGLGFITKGFLDSKRK
jgi:hypothetical protein